MADIAADLERTLKEIQRLSAQRLQGETLPLERAAMLLTQFLSRHPREFSFDNFPLPAQGDDALCSYSLTEAHGAPALLVNAIRGGVDSVIHSHGTWAVIAAAKGKELNRIYRRTDVGADADRATLVLEREATVQAGAPLALEDGLFHSIHTAMDAPTLQLHLYGLPIDQVAGRQVVDLETGRLACLGGAPKRT